MTDVRQASDDVTLTGQPGAGDPGLPAGVLGPPAKVSWALNNQRCAEQQGGTMASAQVPLGNGRIYAFWSGSASSAASDELISAALRISCGSTTTATSPSTGFVNDAPDHLALLHRRGTLGHFPPGTAKVSVVAGESTVTDDDDLASVTLVEMGSPALWHQIAYAVGTAPNYSEYVTVPFTCHGGPLMISASGTGYRHADSPAPLTGMVLTINPGAVTVGTLYLHADQAEVHQAFVPQDFVVTCQPGSYTLQATPAPNTAIDGNDGYSISVFELLGPPSVINVTTAAGPWPAASQVAGTFQSAGGLLMFTLASSACCDGADVPIAVDLTVNGEYAGAAGIYSIAPNVRSCVIPNTIAVAAPAGPVNWAIEPTAGSLVTASDYYSLTMMEVATAWT